MIQSFPRKGLEKYFNSGSKSGIQPRHAKRLRMQMAALDTASVIEDMDVPGCKLHPLRGKQKNH